MDQMDWIQTEDLWMKRDCCNECRIIFPRTHDYEMTEIFDFRIMQQVLILWPRTQSLIIC